MTQTPVAIVGAGPWGRTIAAALAATPGIALAAVVSSDPDTRKTTDPAIPVCRDWREAVDKTASEGVILALPPMLQPEFAIELIENGIPAMLEKPLATTIADADAISRAAATHGFLGVVDHLHVYAPAFKTLLTELSRRPGPRTVRAAAGARGPYRSGWSPLWDWAGHDLAMVLSVIDGDPVEISTRPEPAIVDGERAYRNYLIDLAWEDGSRASLRVGNAFDRKTRHFCVTAAESEICYGESETSDISLRIDGREQTGAGGSIESRPLNAALIAFADRIRNGGGIADIKLGNKVVRLIDAADKSLRSKKPVSPGPL